jgi:hypothetical protein
MLPENWRESAEILSIGPAMQEVPNVGDFNDYSYSASRYPSVIFMVVDKGHFH